MIQNPQNEPNALSVDDQNPQNEPMAPSVDVGNPQNEPNDPPVADPNPPNEPSDPPAADPNLQNEPNDLAVADQNPPNEPNDPLVADPNLPNEPDDVPVDPENPPNEPRSPRVGEKAPPRLPFPHAVLSAIALIVLCGAAVRGHRHSQNEPTARPSAATCAVASSPDLATGPTAGLPVPAAAALRYRYHVPVHSVATLLRTKADDPRITGRLVYTELRRLCRMGVCHSAAISWDEASRGGLSLPTKNGAAGSLY